MKNQATVCSNTYDAGHQWYLHHSSHQPCRVLLWLEIVILSKLR